MIEMAPSRATSPRRRSSRAGCDSRRRRGPRATLRVEVVADHEHVEVLGDGVDRVGPGRVGRRREDVGIGGDGDDVGGVAAAGALGVVAVDPPSADGGERVGDVPGLVERVGVERRLQTPTVAGPQAGVDGRRGRTPVLVQLVAGSTVERAASSSSAAETVLPLASRATLTGQSSSASSMRPRYHGPGVTVVALVPSAGPVPPPTMVVIPAARRLVDDLGADQVDVAVDRPGGEDPALTGEDLGRRADHQVGVDAVGDVGVAGLAERDDPTVAHADVGLDHAPLVEHEDVGDHEVDGRAGGLTHRLADDLAATEHRLVARSRAAAVRSSVGEIEQVGVAEPDPVADRRPVERGVALAR